MKKIAVVYASVHHKNTERLLHAAAENTDIELLQITEAEKAPLCAYKAIGFASGIYAGGLHASVYRFIKNRRAELPKKTFVLCTSGIGIGFFAKKCSAYLKRKGFEVLGAFECKGFNTFGFFKWFGGFAKNHPDKKDMQKAAAFLKSIAEAE